MTCLRDRFGSSNTLIQVQESEPESTRFSYHVFRIMTVQECWIALLLQSHCPRSDYGIVVEYSFVYEGLAS